MELTFHTPPLPNMARPSVLESKACKSQSLDGQFLIGRIEKASPKEILKNLYLFSGNGKEFFRKEVAENIGRTLKTKGLIKDTTLYR
jgi:hypothetical protein